MKFKTPSKPVVRVAYYADNKIPENSQNAVGQKLMVPNGGKSFAGKFLNREESNKIFCAPGVHRYRASPAFCFESSDRPFVSRSLYLVAMGERAGSPLFNETIKL